jgi:hypothetical protein
VAVFWVIAPCSLVDVYGRFRGACCLCHQADEGSNQLLSVMETNCVFFFEVRTECLNIY